MGCNSVGPFTFFLEGRGARELLGDLYGRKRVQKTRMQKTETILEKFGCRRDGLVFTKNCCCTV